MGRDAEGHRNSWADDGHWAISDRYLDLIAPIPVSLSDADAADYAKSYAPLYAEAIGQGKTPEQARECARERVEKKAEPVVIDGPGEYVLGKCRCTSGCKEGDVVSVFALPDATPESRHLFYGMTLGGKVLFAKNGVSWSGDHTIVRKHVPAPRLEEEIGEGEFWAVNPESGERFKVHVRKSAINGLWLLEGWRPIGDGFVERFAVQTQADFDGEFFIGSYEGQLVRRVQQPTTRPYARDELESLVGTKVREKETGDVCLIALAGDRIDGPIARIAGANGMPHAQTILREFEHLDGSPCGVTTGADPWEEPTG